MPELRRFHVSRRLQHIEYHRYEVLATDRADAERRVEAGEVEAYERHPLVPGEWMFTNIYEIDDGETGESGRHVAPSAPTE